MAQSSTTVAAWTLVSRATGLVRIAVTGAVLGPTYLANAFVAGNNVPNLAYSVVAGPVLALVVVPAVVRALSDREPGTAVLFTRRLSGLLTTASGAVALLSLPVSAGLSWVLTAGVPEADRGRAQLITFVLLVVVAPQVVLYTVAALGAAAQQARRRYALAAAAPALENVGLVITLLVVAAVYGTGSDVGEVPLGAVLLLGVGATASVGVHAAVQVLGAARAGLTLRPARGWRRDPQVRAVAARLRGSVPVAAAPAAGLFVLLALAATIPGGVLVFQMAFTVYGVPTALGARAVTTAVLPGMSAAVQAGDRGRFAAGWRQALTYGSLTGLAALCVLVVLAGPIAATLAAGELQDDALVASLAVCIAVLGVAQLAGGIHEIGRQTLYARLDVRGPRVVGLVALAVTVVLGSATLALPAGAPRLTGLSVTVLLADVVAAGAAVLLVRRAVRPEAAVDVRGLRVAVMAGLATLPVLVAGRLATPEGGDGPAVLAVALPAAVLALAVFAGTSAALLRHRGAAA